MQADIKILSVHLRPEDGVFTVEYIPTIATEKYSGVLGGPGTVQLPLDMNEGVQRRSSELIQAILDVMRNHVGIASIPTGGLSGLMDDPSDGSNFDDDDLGLEQL